MEIGLNTDHVANFLKAIPSFLALPFERQFTPGAYTRWTSENWPLVLSFVAAYLLLITVGAKVMESRPAFDLRMPLAGWNAFLCLFSFIGMCRTVSHLNF